MGERGRGEVGGAGGKWEGEAGAEAEGGGRGGGRARTEVGDKARHVSMPGMIWY